VLAAAITATLTAPFARRSGKLVHGKKQGEQERAILHAGQITRRLKAPPVLWFRSSHDSM
jgi:hypothetical protein